MTAHAFQAVLGLVFCVAWSRIFHEMWVSDFCVVVEFCFGLGMRRNSLGVRWGLSATGAGVQRKMKSPGTTSEERLCAEARGRCRSCTSEPAIPCVVTRDGLELYARGDRSSTGGMPSLLLGGCATEALTARAFFLLISSSARSQSSSSLVQSCLLGISSLKGP